jgi:hypothetical protein
MSPINIVVSVKELKPYREWQFLHDLLKAPTCDLD